MRDGWPEPAIAALAPGHPCCAAARRQIAPHLVAMRARFDAIAGAEQALQPRVRHRNMQAIGIIIGDILPVDRARPQRHPPQRPHFGKAIGADFILIGRHHRRHRWPAGRQPHEDEALPDLDFHPGQAVIGQLQARVFAPPGHPGQRAIQPISPGVIGADQLFRATAAAIDQPRAAMPADIGEGAALAIIAAHHDDAFTQIVECVPIPRRCHVAGMANDLPGLAQHPRLFGFEEFRVMINPARQAQPRIGVAAGGGMQRAHLANSVISVRQCTSAGGMAATGIRSSRP